MIAAWMTYCILAAVFFWCCGVWTEGVLRWWRLPARFVWVGTFAVSCSAFLGFPGFGGDAGERSESLSPIAVGATALVERIAPRVDLEAFGTMDLVLLTAWLVASCFAVTRLWLSGRSISRSSSAWSRDSIEGTRVWVSDDVGPAVVGVIDRELVVPAWAVHLDEKSRKLLLRHELEHMWTADPAMRLLSLAAVAIFPWNLGIWLQARSLRESIELDCDRRVVRSTGESGRYAELLFRVAQRRRIGPAVAAGLQMARPPLERRMRFLTGGDRRIDPIQAAKVGALALLFPITTAVLPPPPFEAIALAAGELIDPSPQRVAVPSATLTAAEWLNRHEAPAILARAYPQALIPAEATGTALVAAYVGPSGQVLDARLIEGSGNGELDAAAVRAIRDFRFRPARSGGRATGSWVQYPLTFFPPDPIRREAGLPARPAQPGAARVAIWNSGTGGSAPAR